MQNAPIVCIAAQELDPRYDIEAAVIGTNVSSVKELVGNIDHFVLTTISTFGAWCGLDHVNRFRQRIVRHNVRRRKSRAFSVAQKSRMRSASSYFATAGTPSQGV